MNLYPRLTVLLLLTCLTVRTNATDRFVNLNNPTPASPYTDWSNAATTIQDAIDAANPGDLILVTNGVYQTGVRTVYGMDNRVAVTKPVTVRSVNGPAVTQILGYQLPGPTNGAGAVRCVYLTNGAALSGFTLTKGATQISGDVAKNLSGGGVWGEGSNVVVSNCTLTGNWASANGGGAYGCTLIDCTVASNAAAPFFSTFGGGAFGSVLSNCTLIRNFAKTGGGTFSSTLNNCTLTNNTAYGDGGGAYNSTLNGCILTGNWATNGGGTYSGALSNCILTGNKAILYGGGAVSGTLNNCTLGGNSATNGGGAHSCTLNSCTITNNSALNDGGGAVFGTLTNCLLAGNSAKDGGGGVIGATLNSCMLSGNSGIIYGGGAWGGHLNNCTLTGNSAQQGGGTYSSVLTNCIVYYNSPGNYDSASTFSYCCTVPLPAGTGNLTNEPQLASASHLSAGSPCIDRGASTEM